MWQVVLLQPSVNFAMLRWNAELISNFRLLSFFTLFVFTCMACGDLRSLSTTVHGCKNDIIALNENSIITLELTLLSIFEMNEQQNASQHEANWTDDDVSVAEEWIFTAENRCCREDEKLRSVELLYWVVCGIQLIFMNIKLTSPSASQLTVINFQIIFSARQFVASKFTASVNNTTVKFSEAGQRCCSHPHN